MRKANATRKQGVQVKNDLYALFVSVIIFEEKNHFVILSNQSLTITCLIIRLSQAKSKMRFDYEMHRDKQKFYL